MNIARILSSAGLFVIEDSQAKHRISDTPDNIRISYLDIDDILEAVKVASTTYPAPIALILKSGQVMVLARGGKGGITMQGAIGQLTEEQKSTLAVVEQELKSIYGLNKPTPKAKSKKTPAEPLEPVVEETAPTQQDDPEVALEGEIDANGGIAE